MGLGEGRGKGGCKERGYGKGQGKVKTEVVMQGEGVRQVKSGCKKARQTEEGARSEAVGKR